MKKKKVYEKEVNFSVLFGKKEFKRKHKISEEEEKWLETINGKFFKACFENDTETIKELLMNQKVTDRLKFYKKSKNVFFKFLSLTSNPSPACICCISGSLEVLKILFNKIKGIDVNEVNEDGDFKLPLIHTCFYFQNINIIEYLLKNRDVSMNLKDSWGRNYSHIASIYGQLEVLKFLLDEKKMKLNEKDGYGRNYAHCASKNGMLEVLKFLLDEKKMNLDEKDSSSDENNYAHYASKNGQLEVLKFLLDEKKMKLNEKDKGGRNYTHIASIYSKLEVLKFLLDEKKMKLNEKDEKGNNLLHLNLDFAYYKLEIVEYLLQKGIDLDQNNEGDNPLDLAYRKYGRKDAIKLIENYIKKNIEKYEEKDNSVVNEMNKRIDEVVKEYTPIREEIKNKKLELIKILKKRKRKEEQHERLERVVNEIEKQESHQKDASSFFQKENFLDFHHKLNIKDQIFEDKGVFKENKSDLEEGVLKEVKEVKSREIIRIDLKRDDVLFKFLESIKILYNEFWKENKKERNVENQKKLIMELIKRTFFFFEEKSNENENNNILENLATRSQLLQEQRERNWIFLGEFIYCGVCRHRCLLFKLICDELGIKCRVYRGLKKGGLHNFNVIQLTNGKLFIVDTMNAYFQPEKSISVLDLKTFNKITNFENAHFEDPKFDQVKTLQLRNKCETQLIRKDFFKPFDIKSQHEVKRKFISSGGFGSIFYFPLKVDGNDIVVKEINIQKISNSTGFSNELVQRYVEKEIFFMKFLCHPNIIKIYDHFKMKNASNFDVYLLIMKKYTFDGERFLELLKTYELEKQAIEFLVMLLKVSKGLKYLHDINIIHLDLKPQNILIDLNDIEREIEDVVLTDFGCSKEKTRLYMKTFTFGTPKYCAPEIMEKNVFNEMADIYSLGKVMKDFAFCFEYWNENLNILMRKCLHKDRKSRPTIYQIIDVLKNELENVRKRVKEKSYDFESYVSVFSTELNELYKKKYGKEYQTNRNNYYDKYLLSELKKKDVVKKVTINKSEDNSKTLEKENNKKIIIEEEEEEEIIIKEKKEIIKAKNDQPPINIKMLCKICKRTFPKSKMKCCSKCKKEFYCSQNCQKKDWKFHKKKCQNPSEIIENVKNIQNDKKFEIVQISDDEDDKDFFKIDSI